MTEIKRRLEAIHRETRINWWANKECAEMQYNSEHNTYQLFRLNKDNNQLWEVKPTDINTTNCPIIVNGIIAFVLRNYGNSEKEIFDKYYSRCLDEYKNNETKMPGSSMRDLDSEFYFLHFDKEKSRIDFSQKLVPYLSLDEMNQLNKYAQSYLHYIEKAFKPQIMISNETNILSVSDWSIVFYYLFSAEVLTGVKTKQMKEFIESQNIINPKGVLTTVASFKKKEFEIRNRINGKMNSTGESNWSDKYPPLPPDRIKKILPLINKSKIAVKTAMDDIERLTFETEKYKEKHY